MSIEKTNKKHEVDNESKTFLKYTRELDKLFYSNIHILEFYEKYLKLHDKLQSFKNCENIYLRFYRLGKSIRYICDIICNIGIHFDYDTFIEYKGWQTTPNLMIIHNYNSMLMLKKFVTMCEKHITTDAITTRNIVSIIYNDIERVIYEEVSNETKYLYDNKNILQGILYKNMDNIRHIHTLNYENILLDGNIMYSGDFTDIRIENKICITPNAIITSRGVTKINIIKEIRAENKKYDYEYVCKKLYDISKFSTPIKKHLTQYKDIFYNSQYTKDIIQMLDTALIVELEKSKLDIFIDDNIDIYALLNILIDNGDISKVGDITKYNINFLYNKLNKYYYDNMEEYLQIICDMDNNHILTLLKLKKHMNSNYTMKAITNKAIYLLTSDDIDINDTTDLLEINYIEGKIYIDDKLVLDDISVLTREAKLKAMRNIN